MCKGFLKNYFLMKKYLELKFVIVFYEQYWLRQVFFLTAILEQANDNRYFFHMIYNSMQIMCLPLALIANHKEA